MNLPLTEILRPKSCSEIIGQNHLCGKNGVIKEAIAKKIPISFVLWGEPGSGKTSIIEIYLRNQTGEILRVTGSTFNLKEAKLFCEKGEKLLKFNGTPSFIFIDEIHRLNKAQQDLFLHYLEKGTIFLLGATTENPSFELNKALISRVKIFTLKPLNKQATRKIVKNGINYLEENNKMKFDKTIVDFLYSIYGSDVRSAINSLDFISKKKIKGIITIEKIKEHLSEQKTFYDKKGEAHYNIISALHKSIRNSDIDSSLYWLARMLIAGEDRKYILRRLIRITAEDIGLSDPKALEIAINSFKAFEIIGEPEGDIFLFYTTIYLSLASKSNSIYKAEIKSKGIAKKTSHEPVPLNLRNPETKLMKDTGYGEGYQYAHDFKEKTTNMKTLPKELLNLSFFSPENIGFEKQILQRYNYWKKLKERLKKEK
jgi:putative ATPase